MPFTSLSLGLTLTIPTNGTKNWGTTLKNTTWTKISQHAHTGGGDGNTIPTSGLTDYAVTTIKLAKNYGYTEAAALTPAGTTETIDFNNGNVQNLDVGSASGDVTLTLSNPAQGSIYWIWITQGATARNIIWPGSVKWPQGQEPILSVLTGQVDLVKLYYTGTEYRGTWELDFS